MEPREGLYFYADLGTVLENLNPDDRPL